MNYLSRGAKIFLLVAFGALLLAGLSSAFLIDPNSDEGARIANAAGAVTNVAALLALCYAGYSELTGYLRERRKEGGVLTAAAVTKLGDTQSSVMPTYLKSDRPTVVIDGETLELIEPEAVPLKVLGDLIAEWQDDHLKLERWSTGDLDWVLRKSGPANYPWILKFQNDSEHVFRVSYGDGGRPGRVIVSEFHAPDIQVPAPA